MDVSVEVIMITANISDVSGKTQKLVLQKLVMKEDDVRKRYAVNFSVWKKVDIKTPK